jgi:hypothetical protein
MSRRIRSTRHSPAIIVAALALVAALIGTAVAGPDATTSAINKKKVKKIAKKQARKQINKLAPGLSVARAANADNAANAANADSAANANALGGKPASAFASSASEPYREVGTPGQPQFQNDWGHAGGDASTAAFYKDPLGVVHLKGLITHDAGGGTVAFTLPPGYRPSQSLTMPAATGEEFGNLGVEVDGDVVPSCFDGLALCAAGIDGLTFRVP